MNKIRFYVTLDNTANTIALDNPVTEKGIITYFTDGFTKIDFINATLGYIAEEFPDFQFKEETKEEAE